MTVRVERVIGHPDAAPWIVIHVDDAGIGFDADLLAQFARDGTPTFDAYRRGNNALTAGISGSGLGLAIVGAVVEQAGGRVDVQSAPDRGTRFTLKFPAAEPSPSLRGTNPRGNAAPRREAPCPVLGIEPIFHGRPDAHR